MNTTTIRELYNNQNQQDKRAVVLVGWVRSIRASKDFGFIELNDGSFFKNCQVVFDRAAISNFDAVSRQGAGAALIVKGAVVPTPNNKQPFEVAAAEIAVEGTSPPDYPIQKKRHSFEFLREKAHLRPRTNTFGAVFKIRSQAAFALHSFFNGRGFVYVHTPIITASDCEGAGAMFKTTTLDLNNVKKTADGLVDYSGDFFGKPANLTVSGQLNAEAYAMAYSKVYTFGPTFRAEISNTARHAAEFWMVEPEMAFADLADDMNLAEDTVKYVIDYTKRTCAEELEFLNAFVDAGLIERLDNILNCGFERLRYTDAIDILKNSKKSFEYPVEWGLDLQSEHERYITEEVFKKPVFLTDYPKGIKAFYMRVNDDEKTVAAADLLVAGVGELIGGSQREERQAVLTARMKESGINARDYSWYVDLRKFGGCKHAGFGLGFERMIMLLTGISNIRDVTPFPRNYNNLEF
ncbi:MAG: asparagine--tRNA ligase [Clostridiales bacterium]|jgi:asparaginyl-tRNA synthetase|nr:asparagine--tRNA ligase [Clostridiales bacterium]